MTTLIKENILVCVVGVLMVSETESIIIIIINIIIIIIQGILWQRKWLQAGRHGIGEIAESHILVQKHRENWV